MLPSPLREAITGEDGHLTMLGYGAYALLGWTSVLLASLIGPIEAEFGKTDADIGLVLLFAAAFYGISGLGGGFLTEHLGSWMVLLSAFVILAVCMFGQGVV